MLRNTTHFEPGAVQTLRLPRRSHPENPMEKLEPPNTKTCQPWRAWKWCKINLYSLLPNCRLPFQADITTSGPEKLITGCNILLHSAICLLVRQTLFKRISLPLDPKQIRGYIRQLEICEYSKFTEKWSLNHQNRRRNSWERAYSSIW